VCVCVCGVGGSGLRSQNCINECSSKLL
jgi:hypothetical protein